MLIDDSLDCNFSC